MTTPSPRRSVLVASILALGLGLPACEEETPPPSGGALDNLSSQPQSMYGRSAQAGKQAAQNISGVQQQALGEAEQLTGEASGLEVAGVRFPVPAAWQKAADAAPTRAAQYTTESGATVVFFHFGAGQGGGVEENVARWRNQVKDESGNPAEPRTTRHTADGMNVVIVRMEGMYNSAMPGQEATWQRGQGFRGAIIQGPRGSVFVRLTGTEAAVEEADGQFESLVLGARKS
ncbi:MAG TPA: hypothetical protein VD963_00380 [Phycisphaerales bacterium]|nr:hypothetical protein [Phycisphaerales bacterium]